MVVIYSSDELLARYRAIRGGLTDVQFFAAPGMTRPKEMWCAAHFGRTFENYVHPCTIRMDDDDDQNDYDFELKTRERCHLFQVAEVMEPDRRRGDEYKTLVPGTMRLEGWSRGSAEGGEWVRDVIARKRGKHYSRMNALNLLLYLNYPAYEQDHSVIATACAPEMTHFPSVWLLNGNALCCLKANPALGSFEGWLQIPPSAAYDEP